MVARYRSLQILLIVICVLTPCAVLAQADWRVWDSHMESGQRALEEGRPASAGSWFMRALQEAERLDAKDARLGESLRQLREAYLKQGRTDDAGRIAERLASMPASVPVPTATAVADALDAFVKLLRDAGRPEYRIVSSEAAKARMTGRSDEGLLVNNPLLYLRKYAQTLQARGQVDEAQRVTTLADGAAVDLTRRYARLRQKLVRDTTVMPAFTHIDLMDGAALTLAGGLYAESEAFVLEAVKVAEKMTSSDVTVAYTVSVLADTYAAQGKRPEFEQAAERALRVFETTGLNHDLVARGLRALLRAHLRQTFDPVRVEAHLLRSLRIVEKDLAADHPMLGLHHAGLAATALSQHGVERARPRLEQALTIAGRQFQPEFMYLTLGFRHFAEVAAARGDFALAHVVASRNVEMMRRMADPGHPEVVIAMDTLRALREKLGRPAERVVLVAKTGVPLDVSGNAPTAKTIVNGAGPAALIVDPDATTTVIRPLVLSKLGVAIPDGAPRQKLYVGGGRTIDVVIVSLASFRIGDATIEHVDVAVGEATPGNATLDGVLGGDLLQRFRFTFDRPGRRLTLEPR